MAKSLKEAVLNNSHIQGECRIWDGSMRYGKRPQALITQPDGSKKWVDLQRHLAIKRFNLPVDKRISLTTSCGNPRCINGDHLILLEKVIRPETTRMSMRARKNADMSLNKAVMMYSLDGGIDYVADKTGLSLGVILRIRQKNSCMYPYFFELMRAKLGSKKMQEIALSDKNKVEMRSYFEVPDFVVKMLKENDYPPIHDFDLYNALLDECSAYMEHLVWNGKFLHGEPVSKALDGTYRSARKLMTYALFGTPLDSQGESECGFQHCINPYCTRGK